MCTFCMFAYLSVRLSVCLVRCVRVCVLGVSVFSNNLGSSAPSQAATDYYASIARTVASWGGVCVCVEVGVEMLCGLDVGAVFGNSIVLSDHSHRLVPLLCSCCMTLYIYMCLSVCVYLPCPFAVDFVKLDCMWPNKYEGTPQVYFNDDVIAYTSAFTACVGVCGRVGVCVGVRVCGCCGWSVCACVCLFAAGVCVCISLIYVCVSLSVSAHTCVT